MARLTATQPTFRVRARMARLACSARAIPSMAKISAPTSGIAASSAAIAGMRLTWRTMTYWASQLTAAAAAARTARLNIALRSHPVPGRRRRSGTSYGHRSVLHRAAGRPIMVPARSFAGGAGRLPWRAGAGRHRWAWSSWPGLALRANWRAEIFGAGQRGVEHVVQDVADAPP